MKNKCRIVNVFAYKGKFQKVFFREMTVEAVKIYKMEEVKKHNILKGANKVNT